MRYNLRVPKPKFRRLGKRGFTLVETLVSMMVLSLFLITIPAIMQTMVVSTRETIVGVRTSREQHAALTTLIKDVKSAESAVISDAGKTITLQRTALENGVVYTIKDNTLYCDNEALFSGIIDGVFAADGTVVSATISVQDADPIRLVMRRPFLTTLVDDGHAPITPEFELSTVSLRCNGSVIDATGDMLYLSAPPVPEYTVTMNTVDPRAQILYYTVNHGLGEGMSERIYTEGNFIIVKTKGILRPSHIVVKVVAENGIDMWTYNIYINPQSADNNRVPDWMWGGCEAFRTYMRRAFSNNNLTTVTFGQVRNYSGNLNMSAYNVTAMGEIIGEFKSVPQIDLTNSWITALPDSLGGDMRNLNRITFTGCTRLNYTTFSSRVNNAAWKANNCPLLTVVWP